MMNLSCLEKILLGIKTFMKQMFLALMLMLVQKTNNVIVPVTSEWK